MLTFRERRDDHKGMIGERKRAWVDFRVGLKPAKNMPLFCWHTNYIIHQWTPSSSFLRVSRIQLLGSIITGARTSLVSPRPNRNPIYLMGHTALGSPRGGWGWRVGGGEGVSVQGVGSKKLPDPLQLLENRRLFIQCVYHLLMLFVSFIFNVSFDFSSQTTQDSLPHACQFL